MAAVIVLPLVLSGCASTPDPYFGWGTQGAKAHRTVAAKPKPHSRPAYADNRYNDRYNCYDCNATPVPTARPDQYTSQNSSQKWYDHPADSRDDSDYRPSRPNYSYNDNVRFQWPVRGRVVSEFGSYPGGEKNNGINIAAREREPIRAAADGRVSYSGNELRSYGNLVLLKHDNGYVTAYAHADEIIVQKDQWVSRGQVIGYVGSTGEVRGPQLHFEVRRGSHGETPIDPRQVLGSTQVAYR